MPKAFSRCLGALAVATTAGALLAPRSATAQVIELGPGGARTVYDAPAVFDGHGAVPIVGRPIRSPPGRVTAGGSAIVEAAGAADLSPDLIEAVAWRESRGRAGVVSRAGAVGEMQLMPSTAQSLGVDPYVTRDNYRGGAGYLRILLRRYDGDVVRALSAYNAGPAAVDRYGGTPPYKETQAYVAAVLERLGRRAAEEGEEK